MLMHDDDLEEEDLEGADIAVVPLSIVPGSSSQVLQSTSSPKLGVGPETPRSSQYNERMARARQQKINDGRRRLANNGAWPHKRPNDCEFAHTEQSHGLETLVQFFETATDMSAALLHSPSRPSSAAINSATPIDVISQEVEEMEMEEKRESKAVARVQVRTTRYPFCSRQ
eukprot:6214579-Pleurochrysis_carterae.AAC.1